MISDYLEGEAAKRPASLLEAFQSASSGDTTAAAQQWSSNGTYSLTDIKSENNRQFGEQQVSTGWRVKDGERVYKAFRNGKPIVASGREGYALSLADSKNSRGYKRKRGTDTEDMAPKDANKRSGEADISQPVKKDLKSWFQRGAK